MPCCLVITGGPGLDGFLGYFAALAVLAWRFTRESRSTGVSPSAGADLPDDVIDQSRSGGRVVVERPQCRPPQEVKDMLEAHSRRVAAAVALGSPIVRDCHAVIWTAKTGQGHEEVQPLDETLQRVRDILAAHPGVSITIVDWGAML